MGRGVLTSSTGAAVNAYLAALNSHDADRIAACVSEGFVNEHTTSTGTSRYGRAEYRAALPDFLADFQDLRYEVELQLVDGDRSAVQYLMSCRLRSAGDRALSVRGVFVFRVDEAGLIAHRIDYWDSGAVTRQLD